MKVTLFRVFDSRNQRDYPFVRINRERKGSFQKEFESLDDLAMFLSKTRAVSVDPSYMSLHDRIILFRKVRSLS